MQGGAGLIVAESVHDDSRAPRLVESPEAILRRAAGRLPVEGPEAQRTASGREASIWIRANRVPDGTRRRGRHHRLGRADADRVREAHLQFHADYKYISYNNRSQYLNFVILEAFYPLVLTLSIRVSSAYLFIHFPVNMESRGNYLK